MASPSSFTNLKTLTIAAGDTAYIPKNAVVLAVSSSGDAFASSDCIDLSNVGVYECFEIQWVAEVDAGGTTGPWNSSDEGSATIEKFNIGTTSIAINSDMTGRTEAMPIFDDIAYTELGLITKIKAVTGELFQDMEFMRLDLSGERKLHVLYFRAPAVLADQISMEFQVYNNTAFLIGKAIPSTRCSDTETA